jgi:hypothetical protein
MKYLKLFFPFLITLALWRLSVPFWNPAGILALIPIFYFTFFRTHPWFALFGAIACFLIDYKMGTTLFWTSLFLAAYALNQFQTVINLTERRLGAIFFFMIYIAIAFMIIVFDWLSFTGLFATFWLFLWLSWWYFVFTMVINKVYD